VSWKPCPEVELSAGVRNILDNRHPEGQNNIFTGVANEVPRTFFVELQVSF
jgi:hypothetical protein